MSCQSLFLYSLIVEKSVSHPVRLTASVPLVTLQCPVPTDAIVAAVVAKERRARPCRMWDNTGKEEEGIPELCAEARSAKCLWEQSPVTSPPSSPEDRLCHPFTFVCEGNEIFFFSGFFTGLVYSLCKRWHFKYLVVGYSSVTFVLVLTIKFILTLLIHLKIIIWMPYQHYWKLKYIYFIIKWSSYNDIYLSYL